MNLWIIEFLKMEGPHVQIQAISIIPNTTFQNLNNWNFEWFELLTFWKWRVHMHKSKQFQTSKVSILEWLSCWIIDLLKTDGSTCANPSNFNSSIIQSVNTCCFSCWIIVFLNMEGPHAQMQTISNLQIFNNSKFQ